MLPRIAKPSTLAALMLAAGCSHGQPPPAEAPVSHPPPQRPPPPGGPTRTDFKTIADKLVGRCIGGGWISAWRAQAKDVDTPRPRIRLQGFEDKTGQNLDGDYLVTELERRMRMSGVFEMVPDGTPADFIAHGKILRLAERNDRGGRFSVYTATLELTDPATSRLAYSCEATVQGEL